MAQQETPWPNIATQQISQKIADSYKLHIDTDLDVFVKGVEDSFSHGLYSDVIERCSTHIDNLQDSDTRLLYLRGVSAWRIGLFDRADKDLSPLGDFRPHPKWTPATQYATKIQKMKAILPPHTYEIRHRNVGVFRVFYTTNDPWTAAIVKLLATAYRVNRQVIKKKVTETQVFIFQNPANFKAFYSLKTGGLSPGSWVWASGDQGTMYFCQNLPGANRQSNDINSDYFLTTIVHEFNHTLVGDISGNASMPMWFMEGLAMVFQSQASSQNTAAIKQRMRRAISADGILPLAEVSSRAKFTANTEVFVSDNRQHIKAADPYVQSCFMASYFLSKLPVGGLEGFLTDLEQNRKFDEVFQQHTQSSVDEFYNDWVAQLPHQFVD